jgi:very-short-patch-repair endonuclease
VTKRLTPLARKLRQSATPAEQKLWYLLRNKQLVNLKFRRQTPIGRYIVDFVCFEKKIIVEADGSQHANSKSDLTRDKFLRQEGFIVLRFWNTEILKNPNGIMEMIYQTAVKIPSPNPSQIGRGIATH